MVSKRCYDKIDKWEYPIANNYWKQYPEGILCARVPNDTCVGFYIKEHNNIDGGDNQNIPAKLYKIDCR